MRKFEARPVRAFPTTATREMENAAGNGYLLDPEMDKGMKFSEVLAGRRAMQPVKSTSLIR